MVEEALSSRNRVVAHFRDGGLLKGYTHDFTPVKEIFHLISELEEDKGTIHEIKTSDLKAIFFVKTLEGRLDYKEKKKFEEVDAPDLRGIKIKISFKDGETVRGVSLGYNRNKKGFFIIPVDPHSNNERIYILNDAVKDVKIGKAAEE
jgi:hypothetical protein